MTTDVVAMRSDQTVNEAINAIAYMDAHEPFVNANIIDRDGKLTGYIDLWELLREKRRDRPLGDLVHKDFIAAEVSTDQEEVARLMAHYDLSVIPVVDSQGRLVGRITSDDVLDVMRDEASEDIFRLAGSDDAELETESTLKTCLVRLPWLLITLGGGFVTTLILNAFHSHITNIIILASFVPVILAMGGNTGIQSSTLIIRSIALGQFRNRRLSSLLLKEIASGATMGLVSGILIGAFAAALTLLSPDDAANTPALLVAVTVSLALFASMTFAASFGALAPVILEKIKADPAVASGPFVTITNDIVAALIYFGITIAMITGLS
jgi:magnesium transporter